MKNKLLFLVIALFLAGCSCTPKMSQNKIKKDSATVKSNKTTAIQSPDTSSDDNPEPSFAEVFGDLQASYNKIEKIDKRAIDGADTMQLHETYYCLHDSSLRVPGLYMGPWGKDTTKDFIVNTFAVKIVVCKNRDTVLNRIIKKDEFNKVLWDRLQKYAIIMFPYYHGYNPSTGEFAIGYSLTIPLTDVGAPASITVDKKGNYKILNEYAKLDGFEK